MKITKMECPECHVLVAVTEITRRPTLRLVDHTYTRTVRTEYDDGTSRPIEVDMPCDGSRHEFMPSRSQA